MIAKHPKKGRPQKAIKASEVLPPVRVTLAQKNAYQRAARDAGMSLSSWLKHVADMTLDNEDQEEYQIVQDKR